MYRRKMILQVLALILVAATLAGCGGQQAASQQAEEEKVLNVFNWSEYMPQSVIDKFTAETGIKVNYNTYSSQEEMLAKLQAAPGSYDLCVVSDYMVEVMTKQGLLEPIKLDKIPNFKNVDPLYRNPPYDPQNRYTVPYMWGTVGIAINTDRVKRPVTSWLDLWDPAFAGKIVMLNDARYCIGATLKSLGYSCNETSPEALKRAKARLQELIPRVKAFDSDSPKTLLLNGEAVIGLMWNGETALAQKENPAIKYVYPKEGTIRWQDNMAIPKGAKHPENAMKFMNFILRGDIGKEIAEAYPYASPNAETIKMLPVEKRNNPASYAPEAELKKGEFLKDVGEATPEFERIWTEIKS